MKIDNNAVVSLHYTLREDGADGKFIEETNGRPPLSFIFGIGQMISGFELNLKNKSQGDKFAFLLQPKEAYGEIDPKAMVELPLQNFVGPDGLLDRESIKVGNPVKMKNQEGQSYIGTILAMKPETIVVDFNSPMAGKKLHFSGEIILVRAATVDEIAHGHVHDGTHH
ncbi:MAG: peptidylprolyl isomerase [Saprospiraceae bacterium]